MNLCRRAPTSRTGGLPGKLRCYLVEVNMFGGREGIRTPDPLLAKQVLSQLSYTPTQRHSFSGKIMRGSSQCDARLSARHSGRVNAELRTEKLAPPSSIAAPAGVDKHSGEDSTS